MLAVVLAALAIALAGPLRHLLSQRAQIDSARTAVQAQREQLAQLQQQQAKWADPNYVKAQAEQRLHYVMPGQVPYVSLGSSAAPSASPSPGAPTVDGPWYAQLWSSIEGAGAEPSAAPSGSPSAKP